MAVPKRSLTTRRILHDLTALDPITLCKEEMDARKILLHTGQARCIDRLGIRRVVDLDPRLVEAYKMGQVVGDVVGVGWYTIEDNKVRGHFGRNRKMWIAPTHWLFEFGTLIGAGLIRLTPSCAKLVPVISGQMTIDLLARLPVLPGQTVQGVSWITKLTRDETKTIRGVANTIVTVADKFVLKMEFSFALSKLAALEVGAEASRRQWQHFQKKQADRPSYYLIA